MPILHVLTATIPAGQATADVDLGHQYTLIAIVMPDAWNAADLTFQASADGATWQNVYDQFGGEVMVMAAAGRWITIEPASFAGVRHLRVRSGTSAVPVNQTANRTLTFVVRPV